MSYSTSSETSSSVKWRDAGVVASLAEVPSHLLDQHEWGCEAGNSADAVINFS
jgi:hypothetical protein